MHWVSKVLIPVIAGGLGANAMEASVFSLSSSQYDAGSMTVSEDFARLALKLRMESSVASVLGATEANLEHLNQLAGSSQLSLFAGAKEATEKSLIILESSNTDIGVNMRQKHTPNIFVPSASYDLFNEFVLPEGRSSKGDHCKYQEGMSKSKSEVIESAKECISRNPALSASEEFVSHNVLDAIYSAETWISENQQTAVSWLKLKTIAKDDTPDAKSLETVLQHLVELPVADTQQVTVVILATKQADSKASKRLSERDGQSMSSASNHIQRYAQDSYLHSNLAPICHASNSSCTETTDSCSGRGSCYLKFGSGVEGTTDNCYACRCEEKWGGPACEKKDISSPFFLIAGVSVFAIFAVGSAVGMLFTMGQQELPSVIGAGVGASKAQA